ncbi:MAG: hypothetical protein JKY95_04940 [Planctomycetaceae bacterium]|nr:hypothetical protein [Planctomycetaceae bacterium]
MDTFKLTITQFSDLFKTMPVSQRLSLVLVTAVVMSGFGFLMYRGASNSGFVAISVGKSFSTEELIRAEETLLSQGKTDFQRRGQRLLVPRDKVEEYNSLLLATGSLPQNWAEEWEKQFADIGGFANNKQMIARKEMARANLASQMIQALPDLTYANVMWDKEKTAQWPNPPRSTATVSIRPKPGVILEETLYRAICISIAGMKANLEPEDVKVLDLGSQRVYQQSSADDPFNDGVLQRINQFKQAYHSDIMSVIDYISGVKVSVKVDVEKVISAMRQSRTYQPKATVYMTEEVKNKNDLSESAAQNEPGQTANGGLALSGQQTPVRTESGEDTKNIALMVPSSEVMRENIAGALPENVSVSVVVPASYYRVVALQSGDVTAESTEEEIRAAAETAQTAIEAELSARIEKLIPIPVGKTAADFIDIGSYIPTPIDEVIVPVPWSQTISYVVTQWGSAVALALFGLWAFWSLNKTVRAQTVSLPPAMEEELKAGEGVDEEEAYTGEDLLPEGDTRRVDQFQYLVKNDPEMTASIISNWIQSAK